MPARPAWISRINQICTESSNFPVDRSTLEVLLQIGRRLSSDLHIP
jgi:hypothetical protein